MRTETAVSLDNDTLGYLFRCGIDTFVNLPWSDFGMSLEGPLEKRHVLHEHRSCSSYLGCIESAELWIALQALGCTSKQHQMIWRREKNELMSQQLLLPACGHTVALYDTVWHPLSSLWRRGVWQPVKTGLRPFYESPICGLTGDICDECSEAAHDRLIYYDSDVCCGPRCGC